MKGRTSRIREVQRTFAHLSDQQFGQGDVLVRPGLFKLGDLFTLAHWHIGHHHVDRVGSITVLSELHKAPFSQWQGVFAFRVRWFVYWTLFTGTDGGYVRSFSCDSRLHGDLCNIRVAVLGAGHLLDLFLGISAFLLRIDTRGRSPR